MVGIYERLKRGIKFFNFFIDILKNLCYNKKLSFYFV